MKTKSIEERVNELASLHYTTVLRTDEEGDIVASVSEFEGCVAHGQDAVEALGNLESMKRLWIESCLEDGKAVPLPQSDNDELPSGKWLQRVPRTLHRKLIDAAQAEGVSLNMFVTSCLAQAVGSAIGRIEASSYAGRISSLEGEATSWGIEPSVVLRSLFTPKTLKNLGVQLKRSTDEPTDVYLHILSKQLAPAGSLHKEISTRASQEATKPYAYQA